MPESYADMLQTRDLLWRKLQEVVNFCLRNNVSLPAVGGSLVALTTITITEDNWKTILPIVLPAIEDLYRVQEYARDKGISF